jgi:hypothetical protein
MSGIGKSGHYATESVALKIVAINSSARMTALPPEAAVFNTSFGLPITSDKVASRSSRSDSRHYVDQFAEDIKGQITEIKNSIVVVFSAAISKNCNEIHRYQNACQLDRIGQRDYGQVWAMKIYLPK